jgi:hypothetical protein
MSINVTSTSLMIDTQIVNNFIVAKIDKNCNKLTIIMDQGKKS